MPAAKGTRPPAAGKGRPKGAKNKTPKVLKEMILEALDGVGGVAYLKRQARKRNAGPFMALLSKVLPMQVTGEDGGPVKFERIERVIVDPKN